MTTGDDAPVVAPVVATAQDANVEPGPGKAKLRGRAFYESIGSPKYVVAPMVAQSEFAWRMLTRSFLPPSETASVLAYSPMLHARNYNDGEAYRWQNFQPTRPSTSPDTEAMPYLDGNPSIDRPLFVQFCANDPEALLGAAKRVAPYCDAVDLNLGCPQGIARKGHYGAFLQEDQDLIFRLINILHRNLDIPVTAKIRVLETREATLAYARNVLRAGASILTVHGRLREQKGHLTGLADWDTIRWLRGQLPPETVLFANGNILQRGDLARCLEATGADAVMSAEGNLSDPGLFAEPPASGQEGREYWRGRDGKGGWRIDGVVRRYLDILHRYVAGEEPPARRPLFLPGDDASWMADMDAAEARALQQQEEEEEAEEGPARKKQKRSKGSSGGGKKEKRATGPNYSGMQPHMFHLLRHFVSRHTDVRDLLARTRSGDLEGYEKILAMVERKVAEGLLEYERTEGRMFEAEEEEKKKDVPGLTKPGEAAAAQTQQGQNGVAAHAKDSKETAAAGVEAARDAKEGAAQEEVEEDEFDAESSVAAVRRCKRPWWVAQPIVRPLPKEAMAKGAVSLSKKDRKKLEGEGAATAKHHLKSEPVPEGASAANLSTQREVEEKVLETDDKLLAG